MTMRRLGTAPTNRGCHTSQTCPDVFELPSGDFAVIGTDMTKVLVRLLPSDAGCSDSERIVMIPRAVLLAAKADIPDA